MATDIGEYIVGAHLKIIRNCDVVDYNVRMPGGGLAGLHELDVVGLDFRNKIAYICEVTTHIQGLVIGDRVRTIKKLQAKFRTQRKYAELYLSDFPNRHFMFWSPVVNPACLGDLKQVRGIELVVNKDYADCIEELRQKARKATHNTENIFFRTLQILEHLRHTAPDQTS